MSQDCKSHVHEATDTRKLGIVLAITASYTLAEVIGGLLSNSLALLADAGHMLTDNLAIGLALVAAWTARRPPDPSRTFGYQRIEILAALVNGVALGVVSLSIFWEAWRRFRAVPDVDAPLMAVVAVGGLVVNIIGARVLHGHQGLNVRAAYLHVLGDLLGSVGTIVAAALIWGFGWHWADPVASVLIALVIIYSSVRLVLDSLHVLMEGVPAHLDAEEVSRVLLDVEGVCEVHDLHVWSLAGGTPLLSAHLVTDHSIPAERILRAATDRLESAFDIRHTTLQIEPPDFNIVQSIR